MNDALTVSQVAGMLNIGAGVLFVAALLMFGGGFVTWIIHLGLPHRDEGIIWMEHGVKTLFTLACILILVRFTQSHTQAVLQVLAIAVILLGGYLVIMAMRESGGEEDEKKKR